MKKIISLFLCPIIALTCVLTVFAQGKDCSLKIIYHDKTDPIVGSEIAIYKVADLSGDEYVLSGDFSNDPVDIDLSSDTASSGAAFALYGYAVANKRQPVGTEKTDENGEAYFGSLDEGLYLVAVRGVLCDSKYYGSNYYLVTLPEVDSETKDLVYEIVSIPKSYVVSSSRDSVAEVHVLKKWDDNKKIHSAIEATLYCDGEVYETVKLNSANNWRYVWQNLEAEHDYLVVENDVPSGYSVSVSKEDETFVITNSKDSSVLPINPEDIPIVPAVIAVTTAVGIPPIITGMIVTGIVVASIPILIAAGVIIKNFHVTDKTTQNTVTPSDSKDSKLPYTGVLWWPVPVMAAAGLVLITAGVKLKKRKNEETD